MLASKNSSLSIGAVASEVGIDDAFYFARKFKEFFGKSPREYGKTSQRAHYKRTRCDVSIKINLLIPAYSKVQLHANWDRSVLDY
ncbi:MAG: AraC family transcriptional regulator [Hydrogeniiclostridium mannosilyticum]